MGWRWRIILLPLFCAAIGWGGHYFVTQFQKSRNWWDAVVVPRESASVESLFKSAYAAGVVTVDSSTLAIRVVACEAVYKPAIVANQEHLLENEPVLRRLCETGAGRQILEEIAAWNATLSFAAVRDNRQDQPTCADSKKIITPTILRGCKPSDWRVELITSAGDRFPFAAIPGGEPPFQDYAHAASAGIPFMSDWLVAAAPLTATANLSFSTEVQGRRADWVIDLIGEPKKITVGADEVRPSNDRLRQEFSVGGLRLRLEMLCSDREPGRTCLEARDNDAPAPFTTRITVVGAIARPVHFSIDLGVAAILPGSVRRLINANSKRNQAKTAPIRRTSHLIAECERISNRQNCTVSWAKLGTVEEFGEAHYRILLADKKTEAVDDHGRIRPDALRMGLGSIVGLDPSDVGSLTSALSRQRNARDVRFTLTIDPKIQVRAVDLVNEEMRRRLRRRRPTLIAGPRPRMAIVVVDASKDAAGAILAMASWPVLTPNRHEWDLRVLAAGDEQNFPLAGHAWRATDLHNMPGSTFKVVTALAAIHAALDGNKSVADLLTGRYPLNASARILGINVAGKPDSLPVPTLGNAPFLVHNSSRHDYATANLPPAQTHCPAAVGARVNQLGLCEAILKSSNLWFSGLALAIDRAKLMDGNREHHRAQADLALAKAARQLSWVAEPESKSIKTFDLTLGAVPGALRLRAMPIILPAMTGTDAAGDPRARRLDLALNAYGQGVEASPLAMASVYASIAARRTVRPRLVSLDTPGVHPAENDGDSLLPTSGPEAAAAASFYEILRRGLSGVVNVPGGTAYPRFRSAKNIASRIYAKTGTAITIDKYYSAWLAGWIEPRNGQGRTYAFACWITHTKEYGADACGPVIRRLFEGVE